MARNLDFDILARDKASRTFDKVGRAADQTGKKFGHLGARTKHLSAGMKTGFGVAAGAIAAVGAGQLLKGFIDEAREAAKVGRITANAIKVTGGAANVTAKQVGDLAESISNKTAIDDEAVQSGANLLLTFKNVRNEAGKGAKIFDRATAAAVDLSAAGFGSIEGASKMLGKALNDPIKGLSALSRAGVTFTEQQKKQIKTLVESGRTLEAQKIIMKEIESQVGGAGKAAADPLERLKVIAGNVSEKIGTKLLPYVEKAATWLGDHLPGAIDKAVKWFEDDLVPALKATWETIGPTLKTIWENVLKPTLKAIGWAITKIPEALQLLRVAWAIQWSAIGTILAKVGKFILRAQKAVLDGILGVVEGTAKALNAVGLMSDEQLAGIERFRKGVVGKYDSAISKLDDWETALKKAPKKVILEGKITDLQNKIEDAKDEIKSVPKEKRSEFKGKIDDLIEKRKAAQRELNKLTGRTVTIGLKSWIEGRGLSGLAPQGSPWVGATGGPVVGPGGPTSDSIPALLSNGEHVLTAREVSALGGQQAVKQFRAMVRAGQVPAFAAGGAVTAKFVGSPGLPQITSAAEEFRTRIAPKALAQSLAMLGTGMGGGSFGSGVERWRGVALQALSMAGSPASWIGSLLRRMNQESGGNPRAINLWDSNAAAGIPSKGLMQVIDPTFNAYAGRLRGLGVWNPLANIFASTNYANSRYGSAPRGWDQPGGYDQGTPWVPKDGMAMLHQGEAVVPANVGRMNVTPDDFAKALVRALKANGLTLVAVDSGKKAELMRRAG